MSLAVGQERIDTGAGRLPWLRVGGLQLVVTQYELENERFARSVPAAASH